MTAAKHKLQGTPLGQLFDMGLSDKKISEITCVQNSGVNKWRQGLNSAGVARQMRAKGYLDGLNAAPKAQAADFKIMPRAPFPIELPPAQPDPLYIVSASPAQKSRFEKLMTIGGFEFVDVDQ